MSAETVIAQRATNPDTGMTLADLETLTAHARTAGATGNEPLHAVVTMRGHAKKMSLTITGTQETHR